MTYTIHVDEFGYIVVVEETGKEIRISLTRSSLLDLHAQAFEAAKHAPGELPPKLKIVEP